MGLFDKDEEQPFEIQDPRVKDYLARVYGEKYSDAARQKLADADSSSTIGATLSGLGAALGGRDAGEAFRRNEKAARDRDAHDLANFDVGRKSLLDNLKTNMSLRDDAAAQEKLGRERDPASEESKLAQTLASRMLPGKDFSNMSASQLSTALPTLKGIFDVEQRKLDRADAREVSKELKQARLDEKLQGLQTPYGLANTIDDAKQLKEAHESKKNFDNKINEMIALREKHGGGAILNREDVARGKQLSKDLLLEYKNMAKLGVLSQSDEKIINAIIPSDPLAFSAAGIVGQDPILSNLKGFKGDSDKDFRNRIATRTREGIKNSQESPKTVMVPETDNGETASIARQKRIAELRAKRAGKYASK